MPINRYGVLHGRPIARQLGTGPSPHYQIHLIDATTDYRIAVNVASALAPSEVEYLVDAQFSHPILAELEGLPQGWHDLESRPGGKALDFIRTNLFDPTAMVPLPPNVPGPDNDLNEKLDLYVQRALGDESASVYAFGQRWGPEAAIKDKYFGFRPGNGVHDIHMNQGNVGKYVADDGVYQDGGLLLRFPGAGTRPDTWVGIFLKFQSQAWHTDDQTGHRIDGPATGHDGMLRIAAALVNSNASPEIETVTLLNVTDGAVDLAGWRLLDRTKNAMPLSGQLAAGETLRVTVAAPMVLSNKGGVITLVNAQGLRIDGVTYTKADAGRPGYSVKF